MRNIYDFINYDVNENNIVLFSGGIDSTLVLLDLADKMKDTEETIYTLYYAGDYVNTDKVKKELELREKTINKVQEEFNVKIEDTIINLNQSGKTIALKI